MSNSSFTNVQISAVVTVIPEKKISIDDEIHFFDNNPKKLERAKKMIGYETRYVVDEDTTVVDMAEYAGNVLIDELNIDKKSIDTLILVTQSPDYLYPASSCILHGRLDLSENCATFDVGLGCSGYVYGLWLAHSLINSGASKKVLLLAGDDPSTHSSQKNRLTNPLFGDAASATLLEHTPKENKSYFSIGTRGSGWDKIIAPATGRRLPIKDDIVNLEVKDEAGNVWRPCDEIIKGMDVFNFTMEIAPKNIEELLKFSNKNIDDIDYFSIHQANKQIVENIIKKSNIPNDKTTSEIFSLYGNNSTNSIVTVVCDKLINMDVDTIMLTAFGVGLSWGSAIVEFKEVKNLGLRFFKKSESKIQTRQDKVNYWIQYFKGE